MHDSASKHSSPKQGWLVAVCNHAAFIDLQAKANEVDAYIEANRVDGDGNSDTPRREDLGCCPGCHAPAVSIFVLGFLRVCSCVCLCSSLLAFLCSLICWTVHGHSLRPPSDSHARASTARPRGPHPR